MRAESVRNAIDWLPRPLGGTPTRASRPTAWRMALHESDEDVL